MPDQPQSHFERFLRPILASRFLTISALIHLLIILLFGGRVLFNKYVEPPDFQSSGEAAVSSDVAAPPPQNPDTTLPPQPSLNAPPPPSVSAPAATLTALTSLSNNASSFSMPLPAMAPPTIGKELSAQPQVQQFGNGPAVALPSSMSGRGSGREGVGASYGEKPVSEQSVLRALRWLQSQQGSDGAWGSNRYKSAFTGLALLCFLGHGETPQTSHEFGVVVSKAIDAMVNAANADEGHLNGASNFADQNSSYEHGIGTYAICEAYTMTKDPRLAPVIKAAVQYIIQGQRSDGGWAYRYDTGPDPGPNGDIKSDTSVSGWQIQALKAAHLTGIPGMENIVHPALDLAMKNIDRVFDPRGGTFGYRKPNDGNRHQLTGVGVLAKLFWLGRPDHTVREGLKNITAGDLAYSGPDCNLYAWYYNTQACYQAQGGAWDWWKDRFQDQLTNSQSADGSWPPTGNPRETGGYATKPDDDGPVYRTTLCCLMLEVFYRYLPTSQADALGGGSVEGL
jgi:hypothetical protein